MIMEHSGLGVWSRLGVMEYEEDGRYTFQVSSCTLLPEGWHGCEGGYCSFPKCFPPKPIQFR